MRSLNIETDNRGVCTLTLDRPERRNALDESIIAALLDRLEEIERDPTLRMVILTGAGKAFSGGADLQWMRARVAMDEAANRKSAEHLAELLHRLSSLSKPTLARVNGSAYGGGAGLICCCDLAIASEQATFAFSETKLGLVPAVIAPYIIAAVGIRQARRYFLTAEPFDSQEALRISLVHQAVAGERLDEVIEAQVQHLLKGGPEALAECKRLLGKTMAVPDTERAEAAALLAKLWTSPEAQEGIAAFLEKRKPYWQA
jgi:methylglutaconyl-CoA hydratase